MILQYKRPAVAMIELIFAIVIMGIVLSSAPMLISTASSSTSVALQQEGINEAASRINMILTYPWDENNTGDSCTPPVLRVTAGDSELDIDTSTSRRVGVPLLSNSRTFICGADNNFTASIAIDGSNDIDDFNAATSLVNIASGAGGEDYIEQTTVNIATAISFIEDNADYTSETVAYAPDAAAAGSSNIKYIQVTLTSTSGVDELDKNVSLNAFACNLGGFTYESREF